MAAEKEPSTIPETLLNRKRKNHAEHDEQLDHETSDKRFKAARIDPRFSRVPKKAKRHVVDPRFKASLKSNPGFRDLETPVDRFGRPKKGRLAISLQEAVQSDESEVESEKEGDRFLKFGERYHGYDSSDEDEASDELMESMAHDEDAQTESIPLGKATNRLAVLGLDWSTTRAVDIFASLDSFCPPGRHIFSVEVHPSKFGLERLEKEAILGPQVLSKTDWNVVQNARLHQSSAKLQPSTQGTKHDDENRDDKEGEEEDEDEKKWKEQLALRKYEEERLKYYYAVVQFPDEASADAVYKQCDGVEYAQSGLEFDLRFIPNDMKIESKPRDRADNVPDGYAPPEIASSSLNTSRVKLSWDVDDPERMILKRRVIGKHEEDEQNLKAYLASSSDEEKGGEEQLEAKKRLLLGAIEGGDGGAKQAQEEEEDMNMQISFEPGMFEKGEEIVKRKQEREEQRKETAWEARMRRRAERKTEKRKARRARMSDALDGSHERRDDETAAEKGEMRENEGENSGFDDAFFSAERSIEDAEARGEADALKETSKRRKATQGRMDDQKRNDKKTHSGLLQSDESDDEDVRQRRKEKRKGGRRRAQQEHGKEGKPGDVRNAAVDVKDKRFEKMYKSHLFALDRTHRKYKDNDTNQRIMAEMMRRRREGNAGQENTAAKGPRKANANEDLRELAGRLRAKAKARAAGQRQDQ